MVYDMFPYSATSEYHAACGIVMDDDVNFSIKSSSIIYQWRVGFHSHDMKDRLLVNLNPIPFFLQAQNRRHQHLRKLPRYRVGRSVCVLGESLQILDTFSCQPHAHPPVHTFGQQNFFVERDGRLVPL